MDVLLLIGRGLLAVFFVVEAIDKIRRFKEWTAVVAEAGLPFPAAEMALVVTLLVLGSVALLTGFQLRAGVICLIVFLIPTALFFESSSGAVKCVSLIGALLILMAVGPGRFSLEGGASSEPASEVP